MERTVAITAGRSRRNAGMTGRAMRLVFIIWPQRRRQRLWLAELDKRLLDDIGIEPCEAARESGRPFWQGSGFL